MRPRLSFFHFVVETARRLCAAPPTLGAEIRRSALFGLVAGAMLGIWWGVGAMTGGAAAGLMVGAVVGLLLWGPADTSAEHAIVPPGDGRIGIYVRAPCPRGAGRPKLARSARVARGRRRHGSPPFSVRGSRTGARR
jgi:hypothetical protein